MGLSAVQFTDVSSPPTTLGKYQIIREIARSNDIVYEAYDPFMDRRVALKELNVPKGSTPQQLQDRVDRFEREARAAGRLTHPNVMTVYEVGKDGDRYFMAMEFLDGRTLRNDLDTRGKLELATALETTKAILRGLEHAHSNGVVHRDIKPDNIQLLSNGEIKITDFGIARLTFQPNLTVDGQVFGTPSYMSPEQVRGGDIDARSDLFSVGVVLYEMVAGNKPFAGDNVIAITHAILNSEPLQPAGVGYALWQVIARALDKSPASRYSSAKEMLAAVEKAETITAGGVIDFPAQPTLIGAPPVYYPSPTPVQTPYQVNPYYDPYAGQGQQSQPGLYQPPPTPIPVYYPPPPRKPLLTPDQQLAISRFFSFVFVIGTFLVLVTVALMFAAGLIGPSGGG